MKLNVGCGPDYKPGWVNMDITDTEGFKVDKCASIVDNVMPGNAYELVYAGHVVEHLHLDEVVIGLSQMARLCQPGGRVVIVAPDIAAWDRTVSEDETDRTIWGTRNYYYDHHRWVCSALVLRRMLVHAQMGDAHQIDLRSAKNLVRECRITGPDIKLQCCFAWVKA